MRKHSILLGSALLLLAFACIGCSNDSPVSPAATDAANKDLGTGGDRTAVHIYGNVDQINGDPAPDGTPVRIWIGDDFGYPYTPSHIAYTHDPEAAFEWDTYLYPGARVRVACLGDVVERIYNGGAYMYFALEEEHNPGSKFDYQEIPPGDE